MKKCLKFLVRYLRLKLDQVFIRFHPVNFGNGNDVHVFTSENVECMEGDTFLAHLAYMPMSLCNHDLSVACRCRWHHCHHRHCLCTAVPVRTFITETLYLADICTYIPSICVTCGVFFRNVFKCVRLLTGARQVIDAPRQGACTVAYIITT